MAGQAPISQEASRPTYTPKYIDIGINLSDPIFRGKYRGKQSHPDDLEAVIGRARQVGCTKLIITGSDFRSARDALQLADGYPGNVYATAGIHPCSSSIFGTGGNGHHDGHTPACGPDPDAPLPEDEPACPKISAQIITDLTALLTEARSSGKKSLVAMGEFGLDYDRLHFCSKTLQLHSFAAQLKVAATLQPQLPLFLHSRAAHADFVSLMKGAFGERLERLEKGGVVHSFTGTPEEMRELIDLGLYIGINGCSLKTAENCDVVKELALDKLMLETDGPWCEIRPSHEGYKYLVTKYTTADTVQNGTAAAVNGDTQPQKHSKKNQKKGPEIPERFKSVKKEKWMDGAMVKGRNEPCNIERVADVVAAIKGITVEEVCQAAWTNTVRVFDLDEA